LNHTVNFRALTPFYSLPKIIKKFNKYLVKNSTKSYKKTPYPTPNKLSEESKEIKPNEDY